MGKRYKATLVLEDNDNETFNNLSKIYKRIYNETINIQFKYLSYSYPHKLIDKDFILNSYSFDNFFKERNLKVDKGIIEKAVELSVLYFHKWWNSKLDTVGTDKSIPYTPRHLSFNRGQFFKTSSILKISSKSYLYIPKVGERRLKRLHSVPSGSYKNVEVQFDGKRWVVSLESTEEIQPITKFLRDNLEVTVGDLGTIFIEEETFENIIKSKDYLDLNNKLEKAIEDYQNKKGKERDNKIKFLKSKMNNLVISYYSRMIKHIIASKPRNLTISTEAIQDIRSAFHKKSGILFFVTHLKRRAEELGIKVETLGATFEI